MEQEGRYIYKQCMRNQCAPLGAYFVDGCEEFVAGNPYLQPGRSELFCGACGCHRSFHHRVPLIDAPPPPPLLVQPLAAVAPAPEAQPRRQRTRFTPVQRGRMREYAEQLGWRLPRGEGGEEEMRRFLEETGVTRRAFRVWMHNHRNVHNQAALAPADDDGGDSTATDSDGEATAAAAAAAAVAPVGDDGGVEGEDGAVVLA